MWLLGHDAWPTTFCRQNACQMDPQGRYITLCLFLFLSYFLLLAMLSPGVSAHLAMDLRARIMGRMPLVLCCHVVPCSHSHALRPFVYLPLVPYCGGRTCDTGMPWEPRASPSTLPSWTLLPPLQKRDSWWGPSMNGAMPCKSSRQNHLMIRLLNVEFVSYSSLLQNIRCYILVTSWFNHSICSHRSSPLEPIKLHHTNKFKIYPHPHTRMSKGYDSVP